MKGSCLCGGVRFEAKVSKDDMLYYCHCKQCRKNYGLYSAAIGVPREDFKIKKGEKLVKQFESSKSVMRSFCGTCGSPVLWDNKKLPLVYILAGLIDGKTNAKKRTHIYTASKGDYYDLCDKFPKYKTVPK